MTTYAVCCRGLWKRYGRQEALRGLDLEVPEGSLFGLLGPNGAGKSTTLRILAGLVRPQRGTATIHGRDAVRDHVAAVSRAGFLIEEAVFPPHLTARQVLRRAAAFMGLEIADESPLERVGLGPARDRRAGGFSHGMRQRLGIACALLGAPDLLVLDEPQNGLDPQGLRLIRKLLEEEHARGATVVVSVHRLAEVEGLCTDAAVLVGGRVVRQGPIADLLETGRPRFLLRTGDLPRAREAVAQELPGVVAEARDGALLIEGDSEQAALAAAACVREGVPVFELTPQRRTLDELYLSEVPE